MICDFISLYGSFKSNFDIDGLILGIEGGDIVQVDMEDNIFRFRKVLHIWKYNW